MGQVRQDVVEEFVQVAQVYEQAGRIIKNIIYWKFKIILFWILPTQVATLLSYYPAEQGHALFVSAL